jgi:hypothetical protein
MNGPEFFRNNLKKEDKLFFASKAEIASQIDDLYMMKIEM